MARKHYAQEQSVNHLHESGILPGKGNNIAQGCKKIRVSGQTITAGAE